MLHAGGFVCDDTAHLSLTQPLAQLCCVLAVTFQTQGAHVGQVAFTTALDHWNDVVFRPHKAHMPRSRSKTFSRRCPGSLRSFHSSTHHCEQKVNRPRGTSKLHHRHRTRPLDPVGRVSRSTRPPGMMRRLLMRTAYMRNVSTARKSMAH